MVAVAIGKIDGMFYIGGALLGMFIYAEIYPLIQNIAQSGFMGSVTLSNWLQIRPGLVAFAVILMALGMFYGAELLEKKFGKKEASCEIGSENNQPEN